jgi:folate-binding protein YgfZ
LELLGYDVFAVRLSLTGEDGFVLIVQAGDGQGLLDSLLESQGAVIPAEVGADAQEILRIEAGIPRFGVDMDTSNRLPETTLERTAVSYEKGCYVGQEVIAKLRTYSSVKRALMGLVFDNGTPVPDPGACLYVQDKQVGHLRSACTSPTLERPIALAYLEREHREPGSTLSFTWDGATAIARVVVLPFVRPEAPADRARRLYDRALEAFDRDEDDSDTSAIDFLRESVLLDPTFEDAYEMLGVILHRHGRVDEAIHYMTRLVALNAECLMAHTNLSVFYVAKGMIEEAEEEKAKAAVLQMKQANAKVKAEELAAQERERLVAEAQERIAMFAEVLEIDPEDPLATFGTGQSYMQLQDYEKAIPFLEKASGLQKDYSAAFLNLGKCHEFLGHHPQAANAYKAGIAAANRKGDFMPLREMERRLAHLEQVSKG